MIVTHKISMDLEQRGIAASVDMVQDDCYSRNLELSLFSGGESWTIPEGTVAIVRYIKPDGTVGEYDTLPDGTVAASFKRNVLTAALAPQVLTVPGLVRLQVGLICGTAEIRSFLILIHVEKNLGRLVGGSEDYWNITRFLPTPAGAEAGEYIRVARVDDKGNVLKTETADAAEGTVRSVNGVAPDEAGNVTITVDDALVSQAVTDYLDENGIPTMEPDATLTQAGQAAEAKAVGDALAAIPVTVDEDGYTVISGLRQTTALDFSDWDSGSFTETREGGVTVSYAVTFDADGNPASVGGCAITWPEGT